MTSIPMNQIQTLLQEEKKKLEKTLVSLNEQDPFSDPDRLQDHASSDMEATTESSHERVEALEKTLHQKINDIDATLHRISEGVYGVCFSCKKIIAASRLSVRPTATLCVSCEHKKEQ